MKKLLLFLLSILPLSIFAQSIELYNEEGDDITNSTITVNAHIDSTKIETSVDVKNVSANSIDVKVLKSEIKLAAGSESYFCWDKCYGSDQNKSSAVPIASNDMFTLFSADFNPNSVEGESIVKYKFFNNDDKNDTAIIIVKYNISSSTTTDLNEIELTEIGLPYPNPASSFINFDYSIQTHQQVSLDIFNLVGEKIKIIELNSLENSVQINLEEFTSGLYLYAFRSESEVLKTGKFYKANQ